MNARTDELRAAYTAALDAYLRDADEAGLGAAYQLGRDAVTAELGMLELADLHHETLVGAICAAGADAERVALAAGEFFRESLSAFEMVQRGLRETRQTALAEKRQTAMLRRLSAFLTDASLALEGPDALAEMLQLVAEYARELTGAGWCLATLASDETSVPLVALACADSARPAVDPQCLHKLAPLPADAVSRTAAAELADDPASIAFARLVGLDQPLGGRLSVRLATLDGRNLGSLQLFDKDGGGFTDVDEATILHLAQMAAAAVDRLRLYAPAARPS